MAGLELGEPKMIPSDRSFFFSYGLMHHLLNNLSSVPSVELSSLKVLAQCLDGAMVTDGLIDYPVVRFMVVNGDGPGEKQRGE